MRPQRFYNRAAGGTYEPARPVTRQDTAQPRLRPIRPRCRVWSSTGQPFTMESGGSVMDLPQAWLSSGRQQGCIGAHRSDDDMIKTIAGIAGGLIVWFMVATVVNLLFRVSWPGYAGAEISMTFS